MDLERQREGPWLYLYQGEHARMAARTAVLAMSRSIRTCNLELWGADQGRDGELAGDAVLVDELLQKTALLGVLCELAQEVDTGLTAVSGLDASQGLLHRHEGSIQQLVQALVLAQVAGELGSEAGQGVELLAVEHVVGAVQGLRLQELRVLQVPLQPQVEGSTLLRSDLHALGIHGLDGLGGRSRHHVGGLDLAPSRGEVDLRRTGRVRADQADVPGVALGRLAKLVRVRERHQLCGNLKSLGDALRQVGSDALGHASSVLAGDEKNVGEVDAAPQDAVGGELLARRGQCGGGHAEEVESWKS
mmetsp:Transcript_35015/g.52698  ORF Transcript_35015/g.52698 Transcript_35015/m.52698 type:complete len:304 (+) Transcript_35015:221-1132(+)